MTGRTLSSTSVVAGEPDFVARVRPVVRSRMGSEPAVAGGPSEAVALFSRSGGLLVVQYGGEGWIPALRDLRARWGDGIALVVAMARDRAAEVPGVRQAGADAVVAWDGDPEAVVAVVERVVAARGGGSGPTHPRDVIRRAGALRFRVAQALAAASSYGAPFDVAAVQALLAEIDAALAELRAVAAGLPPQARPAIDAVRSGLVAEAIELTEAMQRPAPGASGSPAPPAPAPAEAVRELPSAAPEPTEVPERRARMPWLVALGITALAAGAFHLRAATTRAPPPEPPTFAGAPRNAVAVRDRSVGVVVAQPGKALDAEEVERFRREEALRGNAVKEIAPGVYVSVPAGKAAPTQP